MIWILKKTSAEKKSLTKRQITFVIDLELSSKWAHNLY